MKRYIRAVLSESKFDSTQRILLRFTNRNPIKWEQGTKLLSHLNDSDFYVFCDYSDGDLMLFVDSSVDANELLERINSYLSRIHCFAVFPDL